MYLDPLNDWLTRTGVGIIAHFQIISSFFLKVSVGKVAQWPRYVPFQPTASGKFESFGS